MDSITILRSPHLRQAKFVHGTPGALHVEMHDPAKSLDAEQVTVASLDDLESMLHRICVEPSAYVVRGELIDPTKTTGIARRSIGSDATLRDVPRAWLALDMDSVPMPATVEPADLVACAYEALAVLPADFQAVACVVQATGSHGIKPGARLRLWFWLDRPVNGDELRVWLGDAPYVDHSVFAAASPIFTAAPVFGAGLTDHLPTRFARLPGEDAVVVPSIAVAERKVIASTGSEITPVENIRQALAILGNDTRGWEAFNRVGMAVFRSSGGSDAGYEVFREWAERNPAYDEAECEARWSNYFRSPPTQVSAGSLVFEARKIDPTFLMSPAASVVPVAVDLDFPIGEDGEEDLLDGDALAGDTSLQGLIFTPQGVMKPIIRNAMILVRHHLKGIPVFDLFANRPTLKAAPPWTLEGERYPREFKDNDATQLSSFLQGLRCDVSSTLAMEAFVSVSREHGYHPVRQYLESVVWDGVPRAETLLINHLGAEDTELNRAVSAKFLISAVARVYEPGCKVDTVLVLEGPQGLRKSGTLKVLAGDWFSDDIPDLTSKDSVIHLQGIWILEHAEFDKLGRVEAAKAKTFITTAVDRFRVPYGKCAADFPRQCVFGATINPGGTGYLDDETGARRYWPVECAVGWEDGRQVDLEALAAVRDQVWAETRHLYLSKKQWHLEAHLISAQENNAAKRLQVDPWAYEIDRAMSGADYLTIPDILSKVLGISAKDHTKAASARVGKILKAAGWKKCDRISNGMVLRGFLNPRPVTPADTTNVVPMNTKRELEELSA